MQLGLVALASCSAPAGKTDVAAAGPKASAVTEPATDGSAKRMRILTEADRPKRKQFITERRRGYVWLAIGLGTPLALAEACDTGHLVHGRVAHAVFVVIALVFGLVRPLWFAGMKLGW